MVQITEEVAKEALKVFREEQKKKRTVGRTYTGCYCDGCVECMKLALESALNDKS